MEREFEQEYKMIGLKVAYYRKLQGYTQEKLADKLGVATSYIGQIEAPPRRWMCRPISFCSLNKSQITRRIPVFREAAGDSLCPICLPGVFQYGTPVIIALKKNITSLRQKLYAPSLFCYLYSKRAAALLQPPCEEVSNDETTSLPCVVLSGGTGGKLRDVGHGGQCGGPCERL